MSVCITKSRIDIGSRDLNFSSKISKLNDNYYYSIISGRKIDDLIPSNSMLCDILRISVLSDERMKILDSKMLIYNKALANADKVEDKVCFSQEYYSMKSSIVEPYFRSVILTDDYEVFIIRAELVTELEEIESSRGSKVSFVTEYIDSVYNTEYRSVDFSSLENYIKTRTDFVL